MLLLSPRRRPWGSGLKRRYGRRFEREKKAVTGPYVVEKVPSVVIIEINAEPTPLTYENISGYLIQGRTGEILPHIVQEVKKLRGC